MAKQTGFIGITPAGYYLVEGYHSSHVGPKKYYSLTDKIDVTTLFSKVPTDTEYEVTSVPAWSERIVRIGNLIKE